MLCLHCLLCARRSAPCCLLCYLQASMPCCLLCCLLAAMPCCPPLLKPACAAFWSLCLIIQPPRHPPISRCQQPHLCMAAPHADVLHHRSSCSQLSYPPALQGPTFICRLTVPLVTPPHADVLQHPGQLPCHPHRIWLGCAGLGRCPVCWEASWVCTGGGRGMQAVLTAFWLGCCGQGGLVCWALARMLGTALPIGPSARRCFLLAVRLQMPMC